MDCNSGVQLGRQFNKDALMFQGNTQRNPAPSDTDNLMQMPMMGPALMNPAAGAEWAQAFQNSRNAALARQTNEMEQAFLASQQNGVGPMAAMSGSPLTMNQQQHQMAMMSGMMAANMGVGMMLPRTPYQPTPLNLAQTQPHQEAAVALNTNASPQEDWTKQLGQQQWAQDYSNAENFTLENQAAESVEEKTKNSMFYSFMDRIRNREVLIDEEKGELVAGPGPEPVVTEDMEYLKNWSTHEGLNMPDSVFRMQPEDVNESGIDGTQEVEDWAREYMENQRRTEKAANSTDYPFEPNNPYVHHDNPYEDGLQMLQLGNLAESALAFEAACQRNNEHFEAWRMLGSTQANNEKDALAIIALNNARQINPRDREVYVELSVSHTNEHNSDAAIDCLRLWLLNHPEYEQLAQISQPDQVADFDTNDAYFFSDPAKMREVITLYHAALEMNPNDADLYTNLGIIYNISHDFDLAAKNFHKTVELRPNDAKVWNKLGATLANGSHSEQALEAYQRALDVDPGYVRAMFNMAVAYNNIGKYPQAARHLVRALAMQQGDTDPKGEGNLIATRGMWDLLRMSLNLMDRHDLVDMTYKMELAPFIREFGLEGMV